MITARFGKKRKKDGYILAMGIVIERHLKRAFANKSSHSWRKMVGVESSRQSNDQIPPLQNECRSLEDGESRRQKGQGQADDVVGEDMELPKNKIIQGAALEVLKTLPAESISCCISSPPYWALRDYGVNGQLGLEKTFEEYIDKLCTIYDEVKRVLRKDGTCFVNLGDTYHNTIPGSRDTERWPKQSRNDHTPNERYLSANLQVKSLCLIPQRFAIEMVNRGWILRNTIIWHKPNPMPSSAKDRFTVDFEYVYFFVKSKKYWFEPQYEPYLTESNAERPRMGQGQNTQYKQKRNPTLERYKHDMSGCQHKKGGGYPGEERDSPYNWKLNPLGRNKRCVWTIPTQPFPEAHFATYPEKLVEPMIKAGCPEFICTKCGKARDKVFGKSGGTTGQSWHPHKDDIGEGNVKQQTGSEFKDYKVEFVGYTDCNCGVEFVPGIVWDPFVGSGTTLQVAARLGRNYGGSELKPEYIEMANKRVMQGESGISVKEQNKGQKPLFT